MQHCRLDCTDTIWTEPSWMMITESMMNYLENWVFTILLLHYRHTVLPFNTVKLLWHNLYCVKRYINKGDLTLSSLSVSFSVHLMVSVQSYQSISESYVSFKTVVMYLLYFVLYKEVLYFGKHGEFVWPALSLLQNLYGPHDHLYSNRND